MRFIRRNAYLFAAGILGIILFLRIYGLEPLRYTGIGWTARGFHGADIMQHQTGWMFYRNSPWSFPLGKALNLGYPEGTSIAYTDSIPLAALFFKLLSPILPEAFQYFVLYVCFCFVMQGICAAALLHLFTGNRLFSVIGSAIFITASPFLDRCFMHTALASHWLLLAGVLLYCCQKKRLRLPYPLLWGILLCTAIGIHPYLFAMVFGVFVLFELEEFLADMRRLRALLNFILCTGTAVLFGFVLGVFGTETASESGYGVYSLNLSAILAPFSRSGGTWSAFIPSRELFDGQLDGMYYIGITALILFIGTGIIRLLMDRQMLKRSLNNYFGLILLCVLYTVFAMSNVVTFDRKILFSIPLPDALLKLLNYFRSSGWFFFLPYYGILLAALLNLYRLDHSHRHFPAVVFCAFFAALQIADIYPGLKDLHSYFETRQEDIVLSEEWYQIAEEFHTARTFDCLTDRTLAFWLANKGFRTDMMISAPVHMNAYWKRTEPERERLRDELEMGTEPLDPGTIYIISTETGKNRVFATEDDLEAYIATVRDAYQDRAAVLYLTDWVKHYYVIVPNQ